MIWVLHQALKHLQQPSSEVLENVRGGMIGGFTIGLVESLGAGYISAEYKGFFYFIILIAILVLKPSGILGERISKID